MLFRSLKAELEKAKQNAEVAPQQLRDAEQQFLTYLDGPEMADSVLRQRELSYLKKHADKVKEMFDTELGIMKGLVATTEKQKKMNQMLGSMEERYQMKDFEEERRTQQLEENNEVTERKVLYAEDSIANLYSWYYYLFFTYMFVASIVMLIAGFPRIIKQSDDGSISHIIKSLVIIAIVLSYPWWVMYVHAGLRGIRKGIQFMGWYLFGGWTG